MDVNKKIEQKNPWYTASHFEWAQTQPVRRIYEKREEYFRKLISAEILKKKDIKLLDYGCGDGYWAAIFSSIGACQVTAIDYNPLRLERARRAAPQVNFLNKDLAVFENNLGEFDVLFCSQVIEHVNDDRGFLKNLKSFLKDDGKLILGTPNEGCLTQRFRNWRKQEKTDHCHFYTEKEIITKLNNAGFAIEDIFREVFYPGSDKIYYKLTSSDFGFKLLELCTRIMPSQCSDYYFLCSKAKGNLG